MINLHNEGKKTKHFSENLIRELKKVSIDIRDKVKYDQDGKSIIKIVGHIIELSIDNSNYRILLEAVIDHRKEFNYVSWDEMSGHTSSFIIQLMDENNNKISLTPELYECITEVLDKNTIII